MTLTAILPFLGLGGSKGRLAAEYSADQAASSMSARHTGWSKTRFGFVTLQLVAVLYGTCSLIRYQRSERNSSTVMPALRMRARSVPIDSSLCWESRVWRERPVWSLRRGCQPGR